MITISLPPQLRGLASGATRIEVEATTLGAALDELHKLAPMIRSQIFDEGNNIRPFAALFVNDRQFSHIDLMKPIDQGSRILIVIAVAGG